jgi:hypothetical protein
VLIRVSVGVVWHSCSCMPVCRLNELLVSVHSFACKGIVDSEMAVLLVCPTTVGFVTGTRAHGSIRVSTNMLPLPEFQPSVFDRKTDCAG